MTKKKDKKIHTYAKKGIAISEIKWFFDTTIEKPYAQKVKRNS